MTSLIFSVFLSALAFGAAKVEVVDLAPPAAGAGSFVAGARMGNYGPNVLLQPAPGAGFSVPGLPTAILPRPEASLLPVAAAPEVLAAPSPSLDEPLPSVSSPRDGDLKHLQGSSRELASDKDDASALQELFDGDVFSVNGVLAAADAPRAPPSARWASRLGRPARRASSEFFDTLLPAEISAKLDNVSALPEKKAQELLDALQAQDLRIRGPPAFAENFTFSLEIEFQLNRQIQDEDLRSLFKGKEALSAKEWAAWKSRRHLSPERWEKAWLKTAARIRSRMPSGWRLTNPDEEDVGHRNTLEIKTSNAGRVSHANTPEDWRELTASLKRVQAALPGGLYSLHMHVGREDLTRDDRLAVDPDRFLRLIVTYEAMWRALAGLGYRAPRNARHGLSDQIDTLGAWALRPGSGRGYAYDHGLFINLHHKFPTIENRIMSGLLKRAGGGDFLNAEDFARDSWWVFALLRAAAENKLPLASLGLPVPSGGKPSLRQILHFADLVYGGDKIGKAIALQRFASLRKNRPGLTGEALEEDHGRARGVYQKLGLGVVYDLHLKNQGWDKDLREHLLADEGALLRKLAADLVEIYPEDGAALSLFPADVEEALRPALSRARSEIPVREGFRGFLRRSGLKWLWDLLLPPARAQVTPWL